MKPEIKKLWVDNLRSGTYQQGFDRLRDGDKYCPYGVLCDLHRIHAPRKDEKDRSGWEEDKCQDPPKWYYNDDSSTLADEILPPNVLAWAGMEEADPPVGHLVRPRGRGFIRLSNLNDNFKHTFNEIADVIEKIL